MTGAPAIYPCASCPYRRDVPSGVWAAHEYEKLPEYDGETFEQPPRAFFCHQDNGRLCAGWVGCHNMEESLGLRLAAAGDLIDGESYQIALTYQSPVPLFDSGAEAAAHGLADLDSPTAAAVRTMKKLVRSRERRDRSR
jgi:hypothetical protein